MRYGKKPEFSIRTSEQQISLFLYVYLMDHNSKANKIEMIITDDAWKMTLQERNEKSNM